MRLSERCAKLSIIGVGMRSHAGVAAQMFSVLAENGINIQAILLQKSRLAY